MASNLTPFTDREELFLIVYTPVSENLLSHLLYTLSALCSLIIFYIHFNSLHK